MAWVSAHEGMKDHPKTRALSRKLQCGRHEAIGILVTLWLWGLNNADREGNIMNATADDIADGIMYRGQSAGQTIQEAADSWLKALLLPVGLILLKMATISSTTGTFGRINGTKHWINEPRKLNASGSNARAEMMTDSP